MILVTSRAHDVTEWIEANCEPPSSYTVGRAWHADNMDAREPQEIELKLTPVDQMLFDLYFAGWFIKCHDRERWFDDTALNRMILEVRRCLNNLP